jgi:ribosomal protein S18 acetylase RimI-like enzyme
MKTIIRKAGPADKDFLVTAIIEAEKSGSDLISYCAIFGISEDALRELLGGILDEEIEGQEICYAHFLIAEVDGTPAAAISAWIEKEEGMASNMIKSNLLMYLLDREIILNAAPNLALMNETAIGREEGALQVECVYTAPGFRGLGLSRMLTEAHIRLNLEAGKQIEKVQVILLKNNASAQRAYEKAGFVLKQEKQCTDENIMKLLPCDTKILMERNLNAQ